MRSGEKLVRARDYFSFAIPSAFMQLLQTPRSWYSLILFGPGGRIHVTRPAVRFGDSYEVGRLEVPVEQYMQ